MARTTKKQRSMALINLAAAQHDMETLITDLTELVQACLEVRMALEEGGDTKAADELCERSRAAL